MGALQTAWKLTQEYRWYIGGFILLVLSFNLNILGLGQDVKWFDNFEKYSESIVYKTIECDGAVANYSGLIRTKDQANFSKHMYNPGCGEPGYIPYVSQYGLQGRIFNVLQPSWLSFDRYIRVIEVVLTVLLAAVLVILVRKVSSEFGKYTAVILYTLIAFSPWLAGYARNLYWVTFILLAPFVFSFVTYNWFKLKKKLCIFYGMLFGIFLLKFLSGYEFAPTLLVSAFIPAVYYELKEKGGSVLRLWRQGLAIFIVGIVALGLAIVVNAIGLRSQAQTWPEAFRLVAGRVEDRGNPSTYKKYVPSGFQGTVPGMYDVVKRMYNIDKMKSGEGNIVKYIGLSALGYMMLPVVTLPLDIHEPLQTLLQSVLVWSIVAAVCLRLLYKKSAKKYRRQTVALAYSYGLGIFGAVSFLILMPGHTFVHLRINAIVFYMSHVLILFIIIGHYLEQKVARRKNHE